MLDATLAVIKEMLIIGVFDQSKNSGEYKKKMLITIIDNESLVKQQKNTLPNIFVSNIQSFGKSIKTDKTTECELILQINNIDISIFCETWLTEETKDHLPFLDYTKYHLIHPLLSI